MQWSKMMADEQYGAGGMPGSFDALARQYWQAWGESLRGAAPPPRQPSQPWQDAVDWWSRFAGNGRPQQDDVVSRFNGQAQQWFGQMQQVAAQFAGQNSGPGDIANAWRQAMGGAGGHPFVDMLQGMRGPGMQGFEEWYAQVAPFVDGMRGEGMSWLKMPAFGVARERQERWQQFAHAQAEYQQRMQAYQGLMQKATEDALGIFERKLAEREEPGRQLHSARALFDLWIDAAEEAYAAIALSADFREVYGKLVDAQMRVRAGVQREAEHASAMFGMPTRTELDGAHRKIVELERQIRRLRDALDTGRVSVGAVTATPAHTVPSRAPAAKASKADKPGSGKSKPAAKTKARPVAQPAKNQRKTVAIPDAPVPMKSAASKRKR